MNIPADLKYTKDHEWVKIENEIATVGITDFAQGELGDIVYIEVDSIGENLDKTWSSLINCKSGIKNIVSFDTSDLPCKIGGFISHNEKDEFFLPTNYIALNTKL